MEVVLDTSFIIACGQKKKDYLQEIKRTFGKVNFLVPSAVLRELDLLKSRGYVKLAVQMLNRHAYNVVKCEGSADDCVLRIARENGAVVASFDRKLRRRAREEGIKLITVRKGAYIMEDLT